MTRCLAVEWAGDGITVVNVAPGYIATQMNEETRATEKGRQWLARNIPMARVGRPEEVASLVGALIGEDMAFLTGETIHIDGAHGLRL
jgi:NAD(P)-dependent dehydrogenase (short-subunit alcohol dehydrogenase family)